MTPEGLAVIVGIVLSIGFEYIPGLHTWFNNLQNNYQRLVMLGVTAVVIGAIFGLGCAGLIGSVWPCTEEGGWLAVKLFIAAMIANQATYTVLPKQNGS